MIVFDVLCLLGLCGAFYLLFKASDVLKDHKNEIEKNRVAIQVLSKRFDEEGENNEQ